MNTILVTMLALQPAPMSISQAGPMSTAQPAAMSPVLVAAPAEARKRGMVSNGRALVARADQVSGSYAPAPGQPSKAELDSLRDQVKSDLDSISDMSEMDQLQLQLAMDRLSKAMSVLSNVLKKYDDTTKNIVGNMK